ncbi:Flagellar assembly protein FliH [Buchnera aphidicola (Cinara kochiana kochiana)]|uniref:Flagellar assembly protein FliH n=1 Tax=Buchnera aphidicola (Cinara kochiana kochiana) TaxID=2518976 RepID=A0A451D5A1_9GAMM|nr:FliH/SctL family protein [Buchnera aphidicola]VFP80967.1 Flagellar assembly protein FliH [Buchnera aphidicola (Cinara kochiana kochiana)]
MKNIINNNLWKKCTPKKSNKTYNVFKESDILKYKTLLFSDLFKKKNTPIYLKIYKEGYQQGLVDGYKKGYFSGWTQGFHYSRDFLLKNATRCIQIQYADLLKKFKIAINNFNNVFSTRLMKIVLHISKILVNDIFVINKNYLLKRIQKLTEQSKFIFNKLQLHVHPSDYKLIIKNFGVLMNKYNWIVISDDKIDINSYRIVTADGEVDASISSFWDRINDAANLSD